MATLTTWEADKRGYFQGMASIGQTIDWFLDNIRKLPRLPKIEPLKKDHWKTWPQGESIGITEEWLTQMIGDDKLPNRERVTYMGADVEKAVMREMAGTHVIVEMLNTDRKTRHRCILLGNVLIATRDGWDRFLK